MNMDKKGDGKTVEDFRSFFKSITRFSNSRNDELKNTARWRFNMKRSQVAGTIFIVLMVSALVIMTSEDIVGRRVAKTVSYRLDFRYWPNWLSFILWTAVFALSNIFVLRYKRCRNFFDCIFQSSSPKTSNNLALGYKIAICYMTLAVVALSWYFGAIKPFWRYLRYKVYADFFQNPVILLTESGQFSMKLLTGPFLIVVVFVLYRVFKSRGTSFFNVFLVLFAANLPLMAQEGDSEVVESRIHLLQQAEYKIDPDLQKISETPSAKNPDGGYDADVSILQCFAVMSYVCTEESHTPKEVLFRMRFPLHAEQGRKYPLIIWFHGLGEDVDDNKRHLAHLHHGIASFVGKDALDFYAIAVQCTAGYSEREEPLSSEEREKARMDIVGEIMESVIKEYPVDENRIGVMGISSGATAAWRFVEKYAGRIAGLVAFSGTPSETLSPKSFQKTAVWAFNNKGDVGTSWKRTSDFINEINAAGGNGCVTLREHGIHDSWSYPLKNENVIRWLTSQSLNGEGFLQEAQYPERSFLKIFLLFLLPITLIIFLIIALRRKQ